MFSLELDRQAISEGLMLERVSEEAREVGHTLSLTANENVMSRTAAAILSSEFESRYHLGDDSLGRVVPAATKGALHYRGLPAVFELEKLASEITTARLGAAAVDFRPLSGVHAMMTTLLALTRPGDIVLSLPPEVGGHFASRALVQSMGRISLFLPWDAQALDVEAGALGADIARYGAPRLVLLDPGMPLFPFRLDRLREALPRETIVVYDASHTLGLIFGGCFQDPLAEGADVLQGNTHKTFPGPQKAMVALRDEGLSAIYRDAMNQGLVSSQHTHHALALYVTVLEMERFGRAYAEQVQRNAAALGNALLARGLGVFTHRSEVTRSHIVLVDRTANFAAEEACRLLLRAGLSTNSRPFGGMQVLRLGVQELTRRGMREAEMTYLAKIFARLLVHGEDPARVRPDVLALRVEFPRVTYSFDGDRELSVWRSRVERERARTFRAVKENGPRARPRDPR
ncbi:hypothetical protein [Sorangium sp. So ce381]|uniref:hypothetical protein n=1 Tax=Sorangium sp. So ce381 TaxID=3133307 RepID=UPI003F5BEE64